LLKVGFAALHRCVLVVEIFGKFQTHPYVISRGKIVELERKDLQNAGKLISEQDERSRQQCECDWEYAHEWGIKRAHNPLCRVHRVTPDATERT
jgi:hypothetical protein